MKHDSVNASVGISQMSTSGSTVVEEQKKWAISQRKPLVSRAISLTKSLYQIPKRVWLARLILLVHVMSTLSSDF